MFENINKMFNFHQKSLNIYALRQEVLASNIANVDTPGYTAVDINFKNELTKILNQNKTKSEIILKKTSFNHLDKKIYNSPVLKLIPVQSNSIQKNCNTVDMNRERVEFINNSLKYQASLVFIKNEIKNIMYVLQG